VFMAGKGAKQVALAYGVANAQCKAARKIMLSPIVRCAFFGVLWLTGLTQQFAWLRV